MKIEFTKMVASGNDFVVIELVGLRACELSSLNQLAKKICDRKFGIGADGLLILEKSKKADVRMRIFNADGSEAEMCGNGARCVARWESLRACELMSSSKVNIETKAGIIESQVKGDNVKIKLTTPKDIKLDIPVKINNRRIRVNFVNTGVPHAVIFSAGLDKINVAGIGPLIRYHARFSPKGTNVNFIEVLNKDTIAIRTYERGVEDETLACGTGSVASALIFALKAQVKGLVNVKTKSKEVLKVYFHRVNSRFTEIWLEGGAKIVYQGVYNF